MSTRITKRDVCLLEMLLANTVMSFEEVRVFGFSGRHKATVCNRLNRLEELALIRRINVGNFIYKLNMKPIGVVVLITKEGIEVLKRCGRFDARLRPEPIALNIQSLIHDLELNSVVRGLKRALPMALIFNGKHLQSDGSSLFKKVPDAVLELPQASLEMAKTLGVVASDSAVKGLGHLRVAVELELTAKSNPRYREIINGYRLSHEVDRVLYLTHDESIAQKIQSVLSGVPVKNNLRPHQGMFSFLQVDRVALSVVQEINVAQAKKACATVESIGSQVKLAEVANG